jgi:anti-sigma regulatory factor (Ser/Thr protein kinase)
MNERRSDDSTFVTVTVPSQVQSVRPAAAFLVQAAKNLRVPVASDSLFELAIVEALNNAVKHGNPAQRDGAAIVCELERVDERLTVRIFDEGQGYVVKLTPRREATADDVMSVPESGYGISIIQSVFPNVRTISRDGRFGLEMSLPV